MKKYILHTIIFIITIAIPTAAMATNPDTAKDRENNTLKINELKREREKLSAQIKAEDAKRNKQVPGVASETLERMNDRQDSICLALRSRLVDINLELKELSPATISPQLMNQYQNMVNNHKPDNKDSSSGK